MNSKEIPYQIVRKDGRNCFVESLSDAFNIGKVHLVFASYDLSKPAGGEADEYYSDICGCGGMVGVGQEV